MKITNYVDHKLGRLPEIKRKVGMKTAEKIIQYSFPQLI